jgi:hypothetical protein
LSQLCSRALHACSHTSTALCCICTCILAAQASDSGAGAPADSACTTGATSSGKASSSSSEQARGAALQPEQQQEQPSPLAEDDQQQQQQQQQAGNGAAKPARTIKIPKLPMVQYGRAWYRAKVLKELNSKVQVEYQGVSHEGGPFWLPKDHARLWRGSYKGRDWRYLVRACVRVGGCVVRGAAGGDLPLLGADRRRRGHPLACPHASSLVHPLCAVSWLCRVMAPGSPRCQTRAWTAPRASAARATHALAAALPAARQRATAT